MPPAYGQSRVDNHFAMRRFLFALSLSSVCSFGEVTYLLTDGASVCSEIRIPKWTRPARHAKQALFVQAHTCGYDLRMRGTTLFIGLSCDYNIEWRMTEKYAVDWTRLGAVRLADENEWQGATALDRDMAQGWDAYFGQRAKKPSFLKSGPKWGADP